MKNKTYQAMDPKQKLVFLEKLYETLIRVFPDERSLFRGFSDLAEVASYDLLEKIKQVNWSKFPDNFKSEALLLIAQGKSLESLEAKIKNKMERREKTLNLINKPVEQIQQLKWLYNKFNEMCPTVKKDPLFPLIKK